MAKILDENTRLRQEAAEKDALIASLLEKTKATEALVEKVELLSAKNDSLTDEVERLAKHFEFLDKKRQLAAAERYIAVKNQEMLFSNEDVTIPIRDAQVEAADAEEAEGDRRRTPKHRRRGRRKLEDSKLPKKKVHATVQADACDSCGGQKETLEPRISYRVEWEPGRHVVLETHQQRCACPKCPDQGVWMAPEPYLLPKAMCADGLLAKVMVDRFGDHLPFNRQAKRMTRRGFSMSANVLAGWSKQGAREFRPFIKAITEQIASG